ncbi:MAG: site-2 protease family protein [Candidatus Zixiibacteriota bacterium]|nr:MAG: site-2 protease family protein [candidate division Zixibacteria bacterium]
MFGEDFLQRAMIGLPILLLSLTVHEYFHAWSALKFGDTTARDQGRLTLHPIAHIDLMGLIVMVASGFRFGWAKPVPVNPFNLRDPRKADFWISFAGPLSNIGLAVLFALAYRILINSVAEPPGYFVQVLATGVVINLALAFFNLIPLFPLDGSHILRSVLPEKYGPGLDQFERISPIILILLVISGGVWYVIGPFVWYFFRLLLE